MNAIVNIDFHGHSLATADINGTPYVAMRPIVDAIGLGWQSQYNRIRRHPVLSATVSMMTTVAKDGKRRQLLMLPLTVLNGWSQSWRWPERPRSKP